MGGGRVMGGVRWRVLGGEGGNQEPGFPSWPVVRWTFVTGLPLSYGVISVCVRD